MTRPATTLPEPLWTTKAGDALYLCDMSLAHLQNARKAVFDRRVGVRHNCWVVDISDGPCADCDYAQQWRDDWLFLFDTEIARRDTEVRP